MVFDFFTNRQPVIFAIVAVVLMITSRSSNAEISARTTLSYFSYPSNSVLNPENVLDLHSQLISSIGIVADYEKTDLLTWISLLKFADYAEIDTLGKPEVNNRINELYLTFPLNQTVFIDIGKIVDRNGVAFFQNPTDFLILSKPNLNIESKESVARFYEGLSMVRMQILLPLITIEGGFAPRIAWNENTLPLERFLFSQQQTNMFYCKTGWNMKGIDMKGIIAYDSGCKVGFNSSASIGKGLELHIESAFQEKYDRINLTNVQTVMPNAQTYSYDSFYTIPARWRCSVVTGGHYTFSNGINLMLEYYYNGGGLTPDEIKTMRESAKSTKNRYDSLSLRQFSLRSIQSYSELITNSGIPGLSQHYLMFRFFTSLSSSIAFECIDAQSLSDLSGSLIFRPTASFNKVDLSLSCNVPYGQANSEFGFSLSSCIISFIGEFKF